jgi:putative oxidoreductase
VRDWKGDPRTSGKSEIAFPVQVFRAEVQMYTDLGVLILRVAIGGVVMQHGLLKLGWVGKGGSVTGVGKWFHGLGMRPGIFWAVVATAAEAGGGLLTVLGLGGPLGPGILAGDLIVVTIVAHWSQGFWAGGGKVGWEFPLPLAAGALAIALIGNGAWSADALAGLTYPSQLLPAWLALMALGDVVVLASRAIFGPKPTQPAA